MADIELFKRKYKHCKSTFKDTSLDNRDKNDDEYLCYDISQEVIDFDLLISNLFPDSNKRPKSFDAIYIYSNKIFCIEFKNQKPSQINNREVKEKIIDGKRELIKLFNQLNISKGDYDFIYCVVYKNCKEPFERYKCGIGKNRVLFDLKQFEENNFIKKVYTDQVSFFTKEFKKYFNKELMC